MRHWKVQRPIQISASLRPAFGVPTPPFGLNCRPWPTVLADTGVSCDLGRSTSDPTGSWAWRRPRVRLGPDLTQLCPDPARLSPQSSDTLRIQQAPVVVPRPRQGFVYPQSKVSATMPSYDRKNALSDAKSAVRTYVKDPSGRRWFGDGPIKTSSRGIISDDAIAWTITAIFYAALAIWIMTG